MPETKPTRPRHPDFEKEVRPELLRLIRGQIENLESLVEVFQKAQALVPPPSGKELTEMRWGKRPLTREAYLIGVSQRAILAAEDLVSDLRTAIETKTLKRLGKMKLSAMEFNQIEAGMERLRG
ncbi:MAG TPA: hypothetical protein VN493_09455 [Thermoanaerobaculia bacterium]|nr:hypothetical protein [Thermoanaerobaculia bacterium]